MYENNSDNRQENAPGDAGACIGANQSEPCTRARDGSPLVMTNNRRAWQKTNSPWHPHVRSQELRRHGAANSRGQAGPRGGRACTATARGKFHS
jgi:hypothetical protein